MKPNPEDVFPTEAVFYTEDMDDLRVQDCVVVMRHLTPSRNNIEWRTTIGHMLRIDKNAPPPTGDGLDRNDDGWCWMWSREYGWDWESYCHVAHNFEIVGIDA